ncbi:MAG TPA: hypothetical protein VKA03_07530 [Methylovirgula sp.]|nr:hypothetical protein [Methylovirgula sp.]
MNKIVKEDYPVAKLPEDLREGLDPAQQVRVTIEVAPSAKEEMDRELQSAWFHRPDHVLSLEEIFALRRPPFRSAEEIEEELRRQRDEWDE